LDIWTFGTAYLINLVDLVNLVNLVDLKHLEHLVFNMTARKPHVLEHGVNTNLGISLHPLPNRNMPPFSSSTLSSLTGRESCKSVRDPSALDFVGRIGIGLSQSALL
jgi:hypothetical protein